MCIVDYCVGDCIVKYSIHVYSSYYCVGDCIVKYSVHVYSSYYCVGDCIVYMCIVAIIV